ncbi:MAG: hypothetical protein KJ601_03135 [Nanoarchaeota archaeon]|nr:hypothetical protein [Nanoarchaeota archaeon]MBU1704395.1 hypothetical protein [Nanoarchaeota archaeon]
MESEEGIDKEFTAYLENALEYDYDLESLIRINQRLAQVFANNALLAQDKGDHSKAFICATYAWAHYRIISDTEGMRLMEAEFIQYYFPMYSFKDRSPELSRANLLSRHILNLHYWSEDLHWLTLEAEEWQKNFSLPAQPYNP